MKLKLEKRKLTAAVGTVSRVVGIKSSIPAIEGILFRAAGTRAFLTGYNLETGITVGMDADIAEPGACIMPARLFFDIIRKLPDDTVSVQVDENYKVSIRGGISSFTITATSADDYPELPDVESDKGIRIPQQELREMISGTIFAVSDNFARPVHTGCMFEIEDDSVTVVAVDGYRLALRRYFPKEGLQRKLKFVAPSPALKECEKILTDDADDAVIYLGSKHILFKMGDATLVCRILDGDFLDWRKVLPQDNPIRVTANVARITDSIERVGLIISEKLKSPVRCIMGDNELDFRTTSTIGEAHDVCPVAGDGGDLEIGFNCKYLLDALRAVPDSEVRLECSRPQSPIILNPTDGSQTYSYMVLPVRLKTEG